MHTQIRKNLTKNTPIAAALAIAAAALLSGCESADENSGSYWKTESATPAPAAQATTSHTSDTTQPATTTSYTSATGDVEIGAEDEVPFGALSWKFGGVNGAKAAKTTAVISGLRATPSTMSYHWASGGCETLGASSRSDHTHTLACFFVQRSDGSWVGGKFDFISTSRTSRSFVNIKEGYRGWSLSGVPNPCPCAFVIISTDGKKRTNVISGTWHR